MRRCGKRKAEQKGMRTAGKLARKAVLLLLPVLLMMVLSACGKEIQQPKPEKTTLELWYYWDISDTRQCLLQQVNVFNAFHDDIQVEAKYVPDEDFKKKLALAIADGKAPDMAIVDSSDVQYYNYMKPLMDVSDYIDEDEYLDEALASCRGDNGELLGLPIGINCLAFYYNKDILQQKNIEVPGNLEEFVNAAVRVTGDDVYGCAFPSLQSEESLFCFLPVLWSSGGSVSNINSEAGKRAFDVLRQLARERGMSHRTVNMTLNDISKEFTKGNIAMMFSTSSREGQIAKENPELNFGVAPLPTGSGNVTVIGGEVLTVLCGEHKEQSVRFVEFLAEPERMKNYLSEFMYLAPRKDILDWQTNEYPEQKKYVEYLQAARTRDFTPYWPVVSMEIADTINQVILEEDQADALEQLEKRLESIREEYYEKD